MPTLKIWDSTANEWVRVCGVSITAPQLEFLSHVSVDADTGLPLWDGGPWPGGGAVPVDPVTYVAPDYVVSGYVQYDRWAVDPVTYMMPDYVVSGYVS